MTFTAYGDVRTGSGPSLSLAFIRLIDVYCHRPLRSSGGAEDGLRSTLALPADDGRPERFVRAPDSRNSVSQVPTLGCSRTALGVFE